jgi:hypothetical protein
MSRLPYLRSSARLLAVAIGAVVAAFGWAVQAGAAHRTAIAPGRTLYDPALNVTWLADADLAGKQTFGVRGIDKDGSMDYPTALTWVHALNAYGGRG